MPTAVGIIVRRRDWHRATALLILSLIHSPLWGVDRDPTVIWKEGSPYSDQLLFNGFVYKTIRVFDERDPSLSLSVAVSSSRDDCPGKGRKCLAATIIVKNEGTVRFDVQPERFECL